MTSRWDVERAILWSHVEPIGRLVVLALLSKSDNKTAVIPAEHTPSLSTLCEMTGMARSTMAEWLNALDVSGWVRRVKPPRSSKDARTCYALHVGADEVRLPKRGTRTAKNHPSSPPSGPPNAGTAVQAEVDEKPQTIAPVVRLADHRTPSSSPPAGHPVVRLPDPSSPPAGPATTSTTKTTTNALRGEDAPNPPAPSSAKWNGANQQVPPAVAREPRQTALKFPKISIALQPPTQLILDWLHRSGYTTADADDARAIHIAVSTAYPGKVNIRYLRTMAANDSFTPFANEIRDRRNKEVEQQIRQLEDTHGECQHGALAGNHPHPVTGHLLCPQCRRGIPAKPRRDGETHPDVVAALSTYRAAYDNSLTTGQLVKLTQQAEALRTEGATAQQLIDLARTAAAAGVGLIAAARERTTA